MILVNPNLELEVEKCNTDKNRRYILLDLIIDESHTILLNIYAPNGSDACAGTNRAHATLKWPETWRAHSGQALAHFGSDACAGTNRAHGTFEWRETWQADSGQACKSFASKRSDRSHNYKCQKVLAHFGPSACARTDRAHQDWGKDFAF